MYLKRLEIYGFKSFGSKSVLDFTSDSKSNIAAIVGPNGSGKSNVADAIRWVLGEQSNNLLRSKKSDDIIFVGSQGKARSSYAEASLHLVDNNPIKFEINNKKHELPEIEVTRKLYRSGESEYLVNKKKVRLLDIQQLLASLGFGQSTYSVIGQGMVDRLLFFNASERRVLFDEAAGIKQYKIKREQAIRKLLNTEENLIRLKDILSELEPRIINLRRLVKRAEGRADIERGLGEIESCYYGSIKVEFAGELGWLEQKKIEMESQNSEVKQKIDFLEKEKTETRAIKTINNEETIIKEKIDKLLFERDSSIRKIAYIQGQLETKKIETSTAINQRAELVKEEEQLLNKIAFLKQKTKEHRVGVGQESMEKNGIEVNLKQIEAKEKENEDIFLKVGKNQNETKLSNAESEIEKLSKDKERLLGEIYFLEQEASLNIIRSEQNKNELKRLNIFSSEIAEGLIKQRAIKENLREVIKYLEEQKNKLDKSVDSLSSRISKIEQEIRTKIAIINPGELLKLEKNILELEVEHQNFSNALIGAKSSNQLTNIKNSFEIFSKRFKEIFGSISLLTESANPIIREKLEKEQLDLKYELEKNAKDLTVTLVALSEKRSELNRIDSEINESKLGLEETKRKIANNMLKDNFGTDNAEIKNLKQRVEQISNKLQSLEEAKKPLSNLRSERENAFLTERDKNNREISLLNNALYEKKLSLGKSLNILENQEREMEATEARLTKIKEMLSTIDKNQNLTDEDSLNKLSEQKRQLAEVEENITNFKNKISLLMEGKHLIEEESLVAIRERHELEARVSNLTQEINKVDLARARLETKLENLNEEMRIMGVVLTERGDFEICNQERKDLLRAKIENMRRKKDSIGEVDPETMVEYQELESRAIVMKNQLEDLSQAKTDLEKIIQELDGRIKNQFSKTFTQIAHEFNRYFTMLFNGGRAELKLGEDETGDLGVEITANPPGKKLQSLNVLSGGERTLTSLSLLFAILSINPSPFCVLDEVDAALDESNTLRFSNILKDLAAKTQFVVISHNRETMKSANVLYGVTMDENHISKLISVKLGEAQKLAS